MKGAGLLCAVGLMLCFTALYIFYDHAPHLFDRVIGCIVCVIGVAGTLMMALEYAGIVRVERKEQSRAKPDA